MKRCGPRALASLVGVFRYHQALKNQFDSRQTVFLTGPCVAEYRLQEAEVELAVLDFHVPRGGGTRENVGTLALTMRMSFS